MLQSVPALLETTNPYLTQLFAALNDDVDVEVSTFSWRRAVIGSFDVLHVHWPELLLRGRSRPRRLIRRTLLLAVLLRIRLSRRVLVRTLHNLRPHEPGRWIERRLLALVDRWTTSFIALNTETPSPRVGAPVVVIPHGHYRDWFAGRFVPDAVPGRFGYLGIVRAYKGVDVLLEAFASVADPAATLRIVGASQDPELTHTIENAAIADPRVTARLEYVDDDAMAAEVGQMELVVLPYRQMHNSGAALLALSLGRPVLVPSNPVTEGLRAEVGDGWVHTFIDELDAKVLVRIHRQLPQALPAGVVPDLSRREWSMVGAAHVKVYRAATAGGRRGVTTWLGRGCGGSNGSPAAPPEVFGEALENDEVTASDAIEVADRNLENSRQEYEI